MPEEDRNEHPIRFKSTPHESEFIDGEKIIDFQLQRKIHKFYSLQLRDVVFEGQQCLGLSFIDVTDQLLYSNFEN